MKRPLEAVIEDVVIQPNMIQPIIVNFQNGHLKDDEADKMECGLFHDEKNKKTVLALSNGKLVYKGYRPDMSKELTHTMLAVYNKKKRTVRLIGAERWDVTPVLSQEDKIEDNPDDDKTALLNKEFGSKKMKRRTQQYEKMKVNVESVKDQLEKSVANIEIDRNELSTSINNPLCNDFYLPPCNREANYVSDVYNIYDIVPKQILKALYDKALQVIETGFDIRNKYLIETLEMLKSVPKNKKKVALLTYMQAVSTFMGMVFKDAKRKELVSAACNVPVEVIEHIFNTYSIPSTSGRQRPPTMKDKAIIHCIILALIIGNYSLNIESFLTIFKFRLGYKKCVELARIVGAVVNKDNKNMVTLKLPLPAPISTVTVKRGKKKL